MDANLYISARLYREALLKDPYRPRYHFAIIDGDGYPGDSNGAFFADGRYHLMYLYRNHHTDAFHWGHISSRDLLHWRHHPDALTSEKGDRGCFSGGAFVYEDGTAYITFWKFAAKDGSDRGGIDIAFAHPPYDEWTRIRPLAIEGGAQWGTMDIEADGQVEHIGCADPSNIWKKDGWYYMQTGNKPVLDAWGRTDDSPERYRGDWTDLFRSKDLKTWQYVHRFYQNPHPGVDDWPDATEDDMCPSFWPLPDQKCDGRLTDRYFQLFISHNKGAQYYIGALDGETLIPEQHGRFSWADNTFFAPEALIDDRNRQIMWCWLMGNPNNAMEKYGWSGVYNFPRQVWLENGELRMSPVEELDVLQSHPQTIPVGVMSGRKALEVKNGASFRLRARIDMRDASRAGVSLRIDEKSGEHTDIYYDRREGRLTMDATQSGAGADCSPSALAREAAPFALREGEMLELDIFVDQSVVEVYANERQAICRRVYPIHPGQAVGVAALADGADFGMISVWEMEPTNEQ